MALILPKGIVVNSPHINKSIERIDAEPLDLAEIAKLWKVYTTTKRRLLDPTAERLENYWWRIWGSRKRELNGATVAKLFMHISDGESFVPLRGPPNRYESGSPAPLTRPSGLAKTTSSTTALKTHGRSNATSAASPSNGKAPVAMPPPILKKTRGPSGGSGPRPTARFISPAQSEDEGDAPVSSDSKNEHVVVQSPSPPVEQEEEEEEEPKNEKPQKPQKNERKLTPAFAGKKFVASAANKKKRPGVPRRQSSQTSQSSNDSATKAGAAQNAGAPKLNTSNVGGRPTNRNVSPTKRSASRTVSSSRGGMRKQMATAREDQRSSSDSARSAKAEPEKAGPSEDQLRALEASQLPKDQVTAEEFKLQRMMEETKSPTLVEHNIPKLDSPTSMTSGSRSGTDLKKVEKAPILSDSPISITSGGSQQNPKKPKVGLKTSDSEASVASSDRKSSASNLLHQSKGKSSAAPTLTPALGQINFGNGTRASSSNSSPETPDASKGKSSRGFVKDILAKMPVGLGGSSSRPQTPENNKPMSKSKSHLSLVLEKDRARSDHENSPKKRTK